MHYSDMTDLEDWATKYEKAVADGVFGEPEEDYKPTPKTSEDSFFGAQHAHPTDDIIDDDAKYWAQINVRAGDPNYKLNQDGLIQEQKKLAGIKVGISSRGVAPKRLNEEGDAGLAKTVKTVAAAPNPIRYHSAGSDQELQPGPLGLTFSPSDVNNLAEMKLKLHALQDELNSFEGRGKNAKKFEGQISSLREKIDELSDAMTQSFPYALPGSSD